MGRQHNCSNAKISVRQRPRPERKIRRFESAKARPRIGHRGRLRAKAPLLLQRAGAGKFVLFSFAGWRCAGYVSPCSLDRAETSDRSPGRGHLRRQFRFKPSGCLGILNRKLFRCVDRLPSQIVPTLIPRSVLAALASEAWNRL
jgi:hypothetical protein